MEFNGKKVSEDCKARFWSRVNVGGVDDCWEWQAGKNSNKKGFNYGIFWLNGKSILAHRLAASFVAGTLLESFEVIHSCDNPPCCNPNHLTPGTHTDNMRDMIAKGRKVSEYGEDRYNAKLTDEKVREIRSKGDRGTDIKREMREIRAKIEMLEKRLTKLKKRFPKYSVSVIAFEAGVSQSNVMKIIAREAWKHVSED